MLIDGKNIITNIVNAVDGFNPRVVQDPDKRQDLGVDRGETEMRRDDVGREVSARGRRPGMSLACTQT